MERRNPLVEKLRENSFIHSDFRPVVYLPLNFKFQKNLREFEENEKKLQVKEYGICEISEVFFKIGKN